MTRYVVGLGFLIVSPAPAQDKPDPKARPQFTFAQPFVVPAGKPVRLKVRGLRLDGVAEVRCHEPKGSVKLLGKPAKAPVPDAKLLPLYGDTQIEIELTLPPDVTHRDVSIAAVNPAGEGPALRLLVDDGTPTVAEHEPNNGFRQAQPVRPGQVVLGSIKAPQDVDVFAFDGKAGRRVIVTAQATRYGSPAEPMLTLYDAAGNTVLASDDAGRHEDARLDLTLPRDSRYYLAVVDANDQGGEFFRYRLRFEEGRGQEKTPPTSSLRTQLGGAGTEKRP